MGGGIMTRLPILLTVVCGMALAACGTKEKAGDVDAAQGADLGRAPDSCVPYCGEEGEAECGDDGCGGTCGECEPGAVCGEADYAAIGICFNEAKQCPAICDGHECGYVWTGLMEPESCDCGMCEAGFDCVEDEEGNYCVDPDCTGEGCPPDKCWEGLEGENGLGALCTEDTDCDTGFCAHPKDDAAFCTFHCQDCCPSGYSCEQLPTGSPDIFFACLPDCQPDCVGKECGDDGCGESCGECSDWSVCAPGGNCVSCHETLGMEGGLGTPCDDGSDCLFIDYCLAAKSGAEKICTCACTEECPSPFKCIQVQDWYPDVLLGCFLCEPDCEDKECGYDDCGGSCGACAGEQELCVFDKCVCQPDCQGKECGPDGCSGSCGECDGPKMECVEGECQVVCDCLDDADCQPVEDSDLCNGKLVCGLTTPCMCELDPESVVECPDGQVCIPETGECCSPSCEGKECGDDGCGTDCGTCAEGTQCVDDTCEFPWWIDSETGLMWENPATGGKLKWDDAKAYCDNLGLGGYEDWHVPTIDQLRTLIRGCPATETGGECNVSEGNCLSSNCMNLSCLGCALSEGPGLEGQYWPEELEGIGPMHLRWSSTVVVPTGFTSTVSAWAVGSSKGSVTGQTAKSAWDSNMGAVQPFRCVR